MLRELFAHAKFARSREENVTRVMLLSCLCVVALSQSEHSDRPRHGTATAACVGIPSPTDALLKRDKEMSQSEVVAMFLMSTMITE